MAKSTSSYKFEQTGGEFVFSVAAAEYKIPTAMRIIFSFGSFILFAVIFQKLDGRLIFSIIGSIAAYIFFGKMAIRSDRKYRGEGGRFKVSSKGIFLNGENIPANNIHRLILRNNFSDVAVPYLAGGMAAGGSGMTGAAMAAGAAIGNAMGAGMKHLEIAEHKRKTAIGYRLDVEYGGNAKTLASGMTETTAYGLMQDVGKALHLSGS